MPRGKRKLSLEEQLEETNKSIQTYEEALITLKERKEALEQEIKAQKLEELLTLIEGKGRTIDDVKAMLAV